MIEVIDRPSNTRTLRLVRVDDIFQNRKTVRYVQPRATARELIERELPKGQNWHLIADGARIQDDAPLDGIEELTAAQVPAFGIGELIVFAIVSAVISAGISYAITLLMGPPKKPKGPKADADGESSQTYSWDGITNGFTQGAPVASIYAIEHRVGGQFISLYRKNSGDSTTQYLFMVVSLGSGPLRKIGQYTSDMDHLLPKRTFIDGFTTGTTLGADENWSLLAGGVDGINITGGAAAATVSGGSTNGAYKYRDEIGLYHDNQKVEAKFTQFGLAKIALALNVEDLNNYHGLELNSATEAQVFKVVGGARTNLFTFTIAINDRLSLWRYDDVLHAERNDVEQATADADAGLDANDAGIAKTSNSGLSGAIVDDVKVSGAKFAPKDMQLNGIDSATFHHMLVSIRMGRDGQKALPSWFSKVIRAFNPNLTLTTAWSVYECRNAIQDFDLNIDFPSGLYDQTGGGGPASKTVDLEVEFRASDAASWAAVAGSPFAITETITTPFTRTISITGVAAGTLQQIRVRRKKRESKDGLIADRAIWADVNEVIRADRQKYEGDALVAIRLQATDQLSGSTPVVTNLVRGLLVPTWNGTSGGSSATPNLQYDDVANPAWIALDILLNKERGLGNWVTVNDVDMDAWKEWADYCDEVVEYYEEKLEPLFVTHETEQVEEGADQVIIDSAADAVKFNAGDFVRIEHEGINQIVAKHDLGSGRYAFDLYLPALATYTDGFGFYKVELDTDEISEPRHTFNGVFDSDLSAWEALIRVCRVGRAVPVKIGNKITVRVEKAGAVSQVISDANMIAGSFEVSYLGTGEQVDIMEVQFLAKDQNYDQVTEVAGGFPPQTSTHRPVRRTQALFGITSRHEARREANYYLLAARLLQKKCKFEMDIDGLGAEAGDIIAIASTLPSWTWWTGRASGTIGSMKVSHELILETGVSYFALVRTPGVLGGTQVAVTSPAGTYPAGSIITTAGDTTIIDEVTVAIGWTSKITTEWRITKTTITKDMTAKIEAVEYRPEVYDLVGWTLDPGGISTMPPTSECVEPGQYWLSFDLFDLPCLLNPQTGCPYNQCMDIQSTIITISGDAEPCVEVINQDGRGFVIEVLPGCLNQQICIEVQVTVRWGDCLKALCLEPCVSTDELCWMTCP